MDSGEIREELAVARACPWVCVPIDRIVKCRFGKGGHSAEAAWDVRKFGEKPTPMCETHRQKSLAKHEHEVSRFRARYREGIAQ